MVDVILSLLAGLVTGGLAAYLVVNRRYTELRVRAEATATSLQHKSADLDAKAEQLGSMQAENRHLTATCTALSNEIELLKEQNAAETRLRNEQFQEQLNVVREQFQNLATTVLSRTSDQLKTENREAMEHITKPIGDSFEQLQKAIQESDREAARTAASLAERLRQVGEQAEKMDRTATRLTNALRGDSKQAGDWGELVLQELLDAQGFKRGFDYDVQDTISSQDGLLIRNEDTGRVMRPDVVLHYPGNQDVVIDAKVSIKAYYDYVNETAETVRQQMLDRHVQSLRAHVKELAQKDYSRYIQPPRTAIDFVIMYVPNEAALQVALARDPKLWTEAFDKKVFISSTQNLFAILRMIQIAWRQHNQTENQKKIVGLAEQLVSRIGLFAERAARMGRDIDALSADFADMQKSVDGTRGILQKANEMKRLGIKEDVKHPLPSTDDAEE
ncbi:MAG: DNA recombination protein RmuC [Prevotella sp.]|nr:DNA recombination protein RmuC [Prevotella sp.]